MKKRFIIFITLLASLIIALPISFFLTLLLTPLWSLLESAFGIESIGHSGPSDWCFILVYIMVVTAELIISFHPNTRRKGDVTAL